MNAYPEKPGIVTRLFRALVVCISCFLLFQLISLFLRWPEQLILGTVSVVLGLAVNRVSRARIVTIALMFISTTATLRYMWWRVHMLVDYFSDESNNRGWIDSTFILILMSAELYTVLIMFLGYMQTAWPLSRRPIPLPADEKSWPHVDLLIPTYNEPLSLVRYTALAALSIDYPPDKLHVYILDDGSRAEFQEFAREANVGYVTRVEHKHAKAGNINHALSTMNADFVAIFDCDHVPTRSFLQMTLGWMMADAKLGMLQTPHHFYSPDPFERNLLQYKTIPNEGELFYGIVQDGNDFWNATFFCGSCALLRRSVLDEVGGIATETVTEDAHTSLRMQKLGYNTAYINIPQAAGLATETLAAHVGQRIRWARGMIQILRTDNPLFAWKMKFSQRLCYFNAMAHFLYAVPRLVFLGAPLVYLLLGRTIIPGYWAAILVYAMPHLILSSMTNSRVQGSHRHSFWNEIYETVLAPYILMPTLLAMVNPKLGKFNVTDKGNTLAQTKFDHAISRPTKWMLLLNFVGMLMALYLLFVKGTPHTGAVVMNLVWVMFNMVILGVAAAVAYEQKQRRSSVRVEAKIGVHIRLPDGREFDGSTIDMSVGGASIQFAAGAQVKVGDRFRLSFPEQTDNAEIDARAIEIRAGETRVSFFTPAIADQETVARALYSRADAWLTSANTREVDRPLVSLARVVRLSIFGIFQVLRSFIPGAEEKAAAPVASTTAVVLLAVALGAGGRSLQASQAPVAQTAAETVSSSSGDQAVSPSPDKNSAVQKLSLKDMGLANAIEMKGPHSYYSLHFTLSYAAVPRKGKLRLIYNVDPSLDPHTTSLGVLLNGIPVGTIVPAASSGQAPESTMTDIPIPDSLLVRANTLTFEFKGSGLMQREDQAKAKVLASISPFSTLMVDGDQVQWQNNLSQLPLPIFDPDLQTTTTIPFVFLSKPSPTTLEAAGVVASWLGLLESTKPVHFVVAQGTIPAGNAIVFASDRSLLPPALQLPADPGPVLALRSNPSDEFGSVLVLAGDNEDQLLAAARTLSLTRGATPGSPSTGPGLTGDTMRIPDFAMPPLRTADDAPRWLALSGAARLANCSVRDTMQSDGSTPIPIYFHVPPDIYYGEKENVALHLHYRYNALQAAAGSALRVVVNGVLVSDIALSPGTGMADGERSVLIPVEVLQPFGNTVVFNYDFAPANRPSPQSPSLAVLNGQILCDSSMNLNGLVLWTSMPNLELFANAGFPFTEFADLEKTTVVLPASPTTGEIALYLYLMSHFGAQTGYPALRVTVEGPNAVMSSGRDYLVLGSIANQPAFGSLDSALPVTFDANGIHVKPNRGLRANISTLKANLARRWDSLIGDAVPDWNLEKVVGEPDALIEETQSPASPDHSIVVIALKDDAAADPFASVFLDRSQTRDMTGPVSLFIGSQFRSYPAVGTPYHLGTITPYRRMRIWFGQYYLLLLIAATPLSLLMARWTYGWMARHAHERLRLADTVEVVVVKGRNDPPDFLRRLHEVVRDGEQR